MKAINARIILGLKTKLETGLVTRIVTEPFPRVTRIAIKLFIRLMTEHGTELRKNS